MKVSHKSFDATTGKFQFQSARPAGSSVGLMRGQLVIEQTHRLPCVLCMCLWVHVRKSAELELMNREAFLWWSRSYTALLTWINWQRRWTTPEPLKLQTTKKLTMTWWSPTSCSHTKINFTIDRSEFKSNSCRSVLKKKKSSRLIIFL